ncbi:MAG TPA: sugar phosphate isomerase/epimerase family protein [Vicinamibacterales bacterium]|nr:sugar phosphate isomerase/epimerase family protein [Vicinamibacterales bacterium]
MKLGLYSITYLGLWYRGPALTLEQVIERAARFGYDGVEVDGKRPHGNPLDLPSSRCRELRQKAADAGVALYAVAANNDFSSPVPEHREAQLVYLRELIRATADLGARTLRVFAAWPGVTVSEEGTSYLHARQIWREAHLRVDPETTWQWCCEGLAEAARFADDAGVTLALQNHAPVTNSPADMLRMIRAVASPHVKACLDAPLAAKQEITSMREAARSVAGLQVLTHFGGEYEREPDGSVASFVRHPDMTLTREDYYAEFTEGMQDIGYAGYTGYELCHPLPPVDGQPVGVEFADKNAQLAAEYMRSVIAAAKSVSSV